MMIAHWKQFGLVVAMLAFLQTNASAEDGRPSQATLRAMGLSGMTVMSDEEALTVRGQGFAVAGGISWAFISGSGPFPPVASGNFHFAVGEYYAAGANDSYADRLTVDGDLVVGVFPFPLAGEVEINYRRLRAGGSSSAWSF